MERTDRDSGGAPEEDAGVRRVRPSLGGFRCPVCRKESHNPNDKAQAYCGNCHHFVRDMPRLALDPVLQGYVRFWRQVESALGSQPNFTRDMVLQLREILHHAD